jgi:hypothetical protein
MTSNLFTISTKIEVFPESRLRIKNKKRNYEEELIIGKVSNDFAKLYSSLVYKQYGVVLELPPFGAHITIADGRQKIDIKRNEQFLNQIKNKQFKVECDPRVYRHWRFYALRVHSTELDCIRKKLGLSSDYPFHITIGKLPDSLFTSSTILTKTLP